MTPATIRALAAQGHKVLVQTQAGEGAGISDKEYAAAGAEILPGPEPIFANAQLTHPAYAAGFSLECAALRRVRDEMGLTNLRVMVPFCRRVEEAKRVIDEIAKHGLKRGDNGLEIYVMSEIPNNVIQIDSFAELSMDFPSDQTI